MTLTVILFAYAGVVATLAPSVLNAGWTLRSPRLALTMWHAAAASVLASLALAAITCVTTPGLIRNCIAALAGETGIQAMLTVAAGLLAPALLFARLAIIMLTGIRRRRTDRRRHLDLLHMLGRHDPDLGVTILPEPRAAAYCVPAANKVVLTSGALRLLDHTELAAALAHERAHLTGRHHLAVAWAGVLAQAFPRLPIFRSLQPMTANLVEVLADDNAVRRTDRASLVGAIAALAGSTTPVDGLSASGGQVLARVRRLLEPATPLTIQARVGAAGAAASLMVFPWLLVVVSAGLATCPLLLR